MVREGIVAAVLLVAPQQTGPVPPVVLHIKVVLVDAEGKPTAVPRHALLVSDNPSSAPPRQVVTAADGTVDISLRPGNYTVESDRPVTFNGKAYQWTQIVDVVAGRGGVLELTAANAEVETAGTAAEPENDLSALLMQWRDSVLALWTPTTHASGFVIDDNGLIVTNQRAVGSATSVEVQLTPTKKVAASVLATNTAHDVAVLRINYASLAPARGAGNGCSLRIGAALAAGQPIFTIGSPLRGQTRLTSGAVRRVDSHAVVADFILPRGSAGGPVFASDGSVVGITSVDYHDDGEDDDARVVRIEDVCDVVASARKTLKDALPPAETLLPLEPTRPFPVDALKHAAEQRAGSLNPYEMTSSDFDIAFITPIAVYADQYQMVQARDHERSGAGRTPNVDPAFVRPMMDFSNWSDYVSDVPPVLLVRVTPKLAEGFWTKVARGAAYTQGMSIPPIKRFKPGFLRMRAFCGDREVTPIHPFRLERRTSETDAIFEGLYVFDPGALGSHCGGVKLVLYSEKDPAKGDSRSVDPKVIEQIAQDFAPYFRTVEPTRR